MTKLAILMTGLSAFALAGCQTNAPASECDGWARVPVTASGAVKLAADPDLRPTGQGVAAHNSFGSKRGCW